MTNVDPGWYRDFFRGEWLTLAREAPAERTEAQADFVWRTLALEPGQRLLDVACGHGRHSLALARRGLRVTGVDLSEPALALARQSAAAAGLEVEWLRADMRELPFAEDFDAAINLWSAFGYFEREDEDLRELAAIAGALRRGGALLLDTISFPGLLRRYQPRRFDRYGDGGLLLEEVEIDLEAGRSHAHWTFVTADGRREERSFSMRL